MVLSPRDGSDSYRWGAVYGSVTLPEAYGMAHFLRSLIYRLKVLLALIYSCCVGMRLTTVCVVLGLSEPTVVDWFNSMCEECTHKLPQAPIILGGEGLIVEIDESLMV